MLVDWYGKAVEYQSDQPLTLSVHAIEITPPASLALTIDMTKLDEICERASGFKEIVLDVDGEMHRYKTDDVLEILKQIEL